MVFDFNQFELQAEEKAKPVAAEVFLSEVRGVQDRTKIAVQNPTKKFDTQELFGSMTVPSSWQLDSDNSNSGGGYRHTFNYPNQDVELAVSGRNAPLSDKDGKSFHKLLTDNPDLRNSKVLYDKSWDTDPKFKDDPARQQALKEMMKNLTNVLGPSHMGDNQFVNRAGPTDKYAPAFHVDRLELKNVNGKTVLAAEGYFVNNKTGKPSSHFSGIFAEKRTEGGSIVNQISLQSGDKFAHEANRLTYEKTLKSVTW
ncbi:MAG: hypothetical protein IAF58_04830 [Leptolyngbya sp.]|nr:hypothetical protein [Candidatus Melainabacteria bacterium]